MLACNIDYSDITLELPLGFGCIQLICKEKSPFLMASLLRLPFSDAENFFQRFFLKW